MKADFEKGTKICSKCKRELPINAFYKEKSRCDGLSLQCKECRKEYEQSDNAKAAAKKALQKYHRSEKGKIQDRKNEEKKRQNPSHREYAKNYAKAYYEKNKVLKGKKREIIFKENISYLKCTKCGRELELNQFFKDSTSKTGYSSWCKECRRERAVIRQSTPEFKEWHNEWQRNYAKQPHVRAKINENTKRRLKEDPHFRLAFLIRNRIRRILEDSPKHNKTFNLIGCTVDELKNYLAQQFQEGMTWENYGEWEIDHIIPCSIFDLSKEEAQRVCFNYRNLQPLWLQDNRKKSSTLPDDYKDRLKQIQKELSLENVVILRIN